LTVPVSVVRDVAGVAQLALVFIRNHHPCGFANAMAGGDRAPPRFNRIGMEWNGMEI